MLKSLGRFLFRQGYRSSSAKLSGENDCMSDGSSNVLVTGSGRNDIFKGIAVKAGVTGSKVMTNAGDAYAGLGDHSETGIGSVFRVLGAIFFIGAGKLYYNGAYTSASASTTLSLKKLTSGSLGTTYQAGLAQPSAPTITAVTAPSGYSGKNNGTVSVRIARVRSATGARSVASLSSNVVLANNQSIAVTFPSADANGQDYWEVDVTQNGQGGLGNHYFLQEIAESTLTASRVTGSLQISNGSTTLTAGASTFTAADVGRRVQGNTFTAFNSYITQVNSATEAIVSPANSTGVALNEAMTITQAVEGVLRSYVFEWRDADLAGADLAPSRDYPPPAGVFGGVSGDVTFVDGAYGDTVNVAARTDAQSGASYSSSNVGNAIAVSDPARPESFPPDNYIFTGDSPTCILEGGQGIHWRFGKNSLGVIRYVGGSPALSYERLWSGIGVQAQHNACLGAGGRLYAFTGTRGLVRLGAGGEPDTSFAVPVMEDIKSFTPANVVLAYDANNQYVMVMHSSTILAFYEPDSIWCAPCVVSSTLSGKTFRGAVTVNGAAYLSAGDGSAISLYDYNSGSGSLGKVVTPWIASDAVSDHVSRILAAIRADTTANAVNVKLYINGSSSAIYSQNITLTSTGFQPLGVLKPNVRGGKIYRAEISYTSAGGDAGFEGLELIGGSQNITF